MNKPIAALTGLLAAQLALAVGMNISSAGFAGEATRTKLVPVTSRDVTRLSITNGKGESVVLAKSGTSWTLPDAGDFPADASKVKLVLGDLTQAEEGAPVATSADAPARFKVASAAFERKIELGPADKPLATIYLGASQGTRQVYVRRAGQGGVRLIDFPSYEASAKPDDWIDTDALKIDPKTIASIAWGGVKLIRDTNPTAPQAKSEASQGSTTTPAEAGKATAAAPPNWTIVQGAAAAVPADANAIASLTDELASLWITGLAPEKAGAADPAATKLDLAITLRDGKTLDYKLRADAGGGYVVTASNLPRPVKMSKETGDALLKETADSAFAPKPANAAATPASPAAPTMSTPAVTSGG